MFVCCKNKEINFTKKKLTKNTKYYVGLWCVLNRKKNVHFHQQGMTNQQKRRKMM